MQLTVTQNIIALNLSVTYLGTTVELQPTIVAGSGSSITKTSQLQNDGEDGVNPFLTSETDPVFQAWLATNPLNGFLTSETDPIFQAWLATNPLNGFLTSETDPIFQAWLATNPLNGFLTTSFFPSDGKTYGVKDGLPIDLGINILNEFPNSIIIQASGVGVSYIGTYAQTFTGTQSDILIGGGGVSYRKIMSSNLAGSNANFYDAGIYRVTGNKGFYYRARIKNEDSTSIASSRFSYGFSGTAFMGNINPSNYVQALLSFAADNTDNNCQIIYKLSGGAASKIDLGSTMPKTQLDEYIIEFLRVSGTTTIIYKITNLTTGVIKNGTFVFPFAGLALGHFRNNDVVASSCGFAVRRVELYIAD